MIKIMKEMRLFSKWVLWAVLGTLVMAMADLWLPNLFSKMINEGIVEAREGLILRTGLLMLVTIIVSVAGAIFSAYCISKASTSFSRHMRKKFFGKLQTFTQAEMSEFGASTLLTRNTNDINQIQNFLVMFVMVMVQAPILMIGGSFMAYSQNPTLAKPLLVALPIIILIVTITAKVIMPLFLSMQKKVDRVNVVLREQISGIRVIRAFVREDFEAGRFDEASKDLSLTAYNMSTKMALMGPLLMLTMNMTTLAILWVSAGRANLVGDVLIGDVLALVQYTMQIMFSLVMLSMVFVMLPRAQASSKRIFEILDKEPVVQDIETPIAFPSERLATVEFKDVSFTFPGAENPTLRNISFHSGPGETTAIIGGTGSGKSTILNMIIRFFDASEGEVLVNGIDVKEMPQADLRKAIGYVTQKAQLFSGTIAENIRYGKQDASYEEMTEAARIAQALDFIEKEEGQFEGHVAQAGTNFSGGQKQRLSIARAIVRNPEVYLFDDSFSALDAATDLALRQELRKVTKQSTTIIVAQRISSILHADRILVVDDGVIVGQGKHDELIKDCEVYREIAASQFSEEEVG